MKWNSMWSVFIVIPTSVFAMADRTPPVYGRPTLYGEYEVVADDVARAGKMYGAAPHAQPIRVATPTKTPAAKHPTKPKKSGPRKKAQKKSAPVARAVTKSPQTDTATTVPENVDVVVADAAPAKIVEIEVSSETAPIVADAVVAAPTEPVRAPAPQPTPQAADIAGAVANKLDADSYCTSQAQAPGGNMPDGFILMPGRPDLMSCRGKKQ